MTAIFRPKDITELPAMVSEWVKQTLAEKVNASIEDTQAASVVLNKLVSVVMVINAQAKDGLTISDAPYILGATIRSVVESVEETNLDGVSKKALVKLLVVHLYQLIDRGVDGTENRINIPWVPTSISNWVEDNLLPFFVDIAVEAIVSGWNKHKPDVFSGL